MLLAKSIDKLKIILVTPTWFLFNYLLIRIQNVKYVIFPKISGFIKIRNRGTLSMGSNLIITSCREGNPVGLANGSFLYCAPSSSLIIGNNVAISNSTIFSLKSIIIEDDVMIGGGVQIYDSDFHQLSYNDRMENIPNKIKSSPVHLMKGCFIGASSIILKGVSIGERSIIGAGSVVSKSVPKDEIWGGNPCRFIKRNA
jgi:acetyltransferase-like isoleucine patch superfamily enzyme